jgi:hypothetical protein
VAGKAHESTMEDSPCSGANNTTALTSAVTQVLTPCQAIDRLPALTADLFKENETPATCELVLLSRQATAIRGWSLADSGPLRAAKAEQVGWASVDRFV